MRKYLIFIMLLLTVLACKPKQKPRDNFGGSGGTIKPPTITSDDENNIMAILNKMVEGKDDNVSTWQNSDWKDIPVLTGGDIGKITDNGFFVANYAEQTWITFSVNNPNDRDVYVGMEQGYDKLEEALALLADESGKLRAESWDPRKLAYNYDGDAGELKIAWLGRARWDWRFNGDKRYRGEYDTLYPNPLRYLTGDGKTYGTIRQYQSINPTSIVLNDNLRGMEVLTGLNLGGGLPLEDIVEASDETDRKRKVWGSDMYYVNDTTKSPKYKGTDVSVTTREALRFAYTEGDESGYPSGIGTEKGNKATPSDATEEDKKEGGRYYAGGYDTRDPLGKTAFYRTTTSTDDKNSGAKVQFYITVVAYNIRMREAKHQDASSLFGGEYNVKEVIFEFDDKSFDDITGDKFANNDIPKRQLKDPSYEIKPGSRTKTHKIPLLYFSPK